MFKIPMFYEHEIQEDSHKENCGVYSGCFKGVGVFAEFERAMIQERVNAGLARARAEGKALGRPKLDDEVVAKVLEDRAKGMSLRKLKEKHGVSLGAVHKIVHSK